MSSKIKIIKLKEEEQLNSPSCVQQKNKALRSCEDIMLDIQGVKENALSEGDYKTALKAIELEGKQLALFSQHLENNDKNNNKNENDEVSTTIKDFLSSLDGEEE